VDPSLNLKTRGVFKISKSTPPIAPADLKHTESKSTPQLKNHQKYTSKLHIKNIHQNYTSKIYIKNTNQKYTSKFSYIFIPPYFSREKYVVRNLMRDIGVTCHAHVTLYDNLWPLHTFFAHFLSMSRFSLCHALRLHVGGERDMGFCDSLKIVSRCHALRLCVGVGRDMPIF